MSDLALYPSLCAQTCFKSELDLLFTCTVTDNISFRMCQHRCHAHSAEEHTNFLNGRCTCPNIYQPFCANNKNYFNQCFAECSGFDSGTNGFCFGSESWESDVNRDFDPVCSSEGKTYVNEPMAKFMKKVVSHPGNCQ